MFTKKIIQLAELSFDWKWQKKLAWNWQPRIKFGWEKKH
jgi:hypothetical protein